MTAESVGAPIVKGAVVKPVVAEVADGGPGEAFVGVDSKASRAGERAATGDILLGGFKTVEFQLQFTVGRAQDDAGVLTHSGGVGNGVEGRIHTGRTDSEVIRFVVEEREPLERVENDTPGAGPSGLFRVGIGERASPSLRICRIDLTGVITHLIGGQG